MTTLCESQTTTIGGIGTLPVAGDPVCLVDFNAGNGRPIVRIATKDELNGSRTVLGIAKTTAGVGAPHTLDVWTTGEVADAGITGFTPPGGATGIVAVVDRALLFVARPN